MQGFLRWTEDSARTWAQIEQLDCWQVGDATVGYLKPECGLRAQPAGRSSTGSRAEPCSLPCSFSARLRAFPDVFQLQEREQGGHTVTLSGRLSSAEERTQAVAGVPRAVRLAAPAQAAEP